MDKKGVMVLSMVFLLVVSAGCQQIGGVGTRVNQREADEIGDEVHRGIKGITLSFVKNNPPKILYTTTPLSVLVEIKNEGAATVSGGDLHLSGIDQRIVRLDDTLKPFNAEGKSRYNLFGGFEVVEFRSQAVHLPGGTDVYKPTILASACYNYETKASPLICIDPDPYSVLEKEACEVRDVGMAGGQGAPVAVTNVEEEAIPGRVNFKIHVSNQGGGVIIDKSAQSMNRCPGDLQYADIDTVYYTVTLAGQAGECKPDNKIKLTDGKGTLFCTFQISGDQPAYQTILNIGLSYGYLSQISTPVEIRSIS
ncbi:hypothetical protein ACFLZ7_03485 [Nanoarchaeota archaeon]